MKNDLIISFVTEEYVALSVVDSKEFRALARMELFRIHGADYDQKFQQCDESGPGVLLKEIAFQILCLTKADWKMGFGWNTADEEQLSDIVNSSSLLSRFHNYIKIQEVYSYKPHLFDIDSKEAAHV